MYYGKVKGANGWRFLTDALSVTVFTGYVWMVGQTGEKKSVFKQKRIRVDRTLIVVEKQYI